MTSYHTQNVIETVVIPNKHVNIDSGSDTVVISIKSKGGKITTRRTTGLGEKKITEVAYYVHTKEDIHTRMRYAYVMASHIMPLHYVIISQASIYSRIQCIT